MAHGYFTSADIVPASLDGVDLNRMWAELADTLRLLNARRYALAALLTFATTDASDMVAQASGRDDFEIASEFGVPVGMRMRPDMLRLAYDFEDYDSATRFTARFLRDSTAQQIEAAHNMVLEADHRLVFRGVMRALLDPAARENEHGQPVYALWNGADGLTPPPYLENTFTSTHSHYTVSGAALVDSGDLEALVDSVQEHGYGVDEGTQLLIFVNRTEGRHVRSFRAGQLNNNSVMANWDFVPSESAPSYLSSEQIVGSVPPAQFNRLPVIGGYGPALIVEDGLIPSGYVICAATGGPGSALNPIGFREHVQTAHQGLRHIPGPQPAYPLTGSTYTRAFGTGVRHRGAAAVMQVKASGSYQAPALGGVL